MKNLQVIDNFSKVKFSLLIFPFIIISLIIIILYQNNALSEEGYARFQEDFFYFLNQKLSQNADLQYNLTQLGDAFIALSVLSFMVYYAPKIWEGLIFSSLISIIFSKVPKEVFDVPRPATIFEHDNFNIIGEAAVGYSSMPSGHNITIFTMLSVILLGFMPKSWNGKIVWILSFLVLGYFLGFTRVGVGAHHPLDVIIGSALGFSSAVLGIILNKKYPIFSWLHHEKYNWFFIILFIGSIAFIIFKIMNESLPIYYFTLIQLISTLFHLIHQRYVQRKSK